MDKNVCILHANALSYGEIVEQTEPSGWREGKPTIQNKLWEVCQ